MYPHQTNADTSVGKVPPHQHVLSAAEERLRLLELGVELLIANTKLGEFRLEGFHEAALLLEAIPLTTSDFDATRRHLGNALTYCQLNEFGCAAFELRVVRGNLQRL